MKCAVLCVKHDWKDSSEACAIASQNCAVYSVFSSGVTSHSKIAHFNWTCMAPCTAVQREGITAVEIECRRLSSLLWRHPLCLLRIPISNLWLVCCTRHNKFVSWSLRFMKRFCLPREENLYSFHLSRSVRCFYVQCWSHATYCNTQMSNLSDTRPAMLCDLHGHKLQHILNNRLCLDGYVGYNLGWKCKKYYFLSLE